LEQAQAFLLSTGPIQTLNRNPSFKKHPTCGFIIFSTHQKKQEAYISRWRLASLQKKLSVLPYYLPLLWQRGLITQHKEGSMRIILFTNWAFPKYFWEKSFQGALAKESLSSSSLQAIDPFHAKEYRQ
jgi:hypothetical protein